MTNNKPDYRFMLEAVRLSAQAVQQGTGGPFGAVVVKNGEIIASGNNCVTSTNDPTAHAEVVAIRAACAALNTHQLTGCDLYTSCEPCPMCLGAIYWARPDRVFYANNRYDAAKIGFDDRLIYDEIVLTPQERKIPFIHLPCPEAVQPFTDWLNSTQKITY